VVIATLAVVQSRRTCVFPPSLVATSLLQDGPLAESPPILLYVYTRIHVHTHTQAHLYCSAERDDDGLKWLRMTS
jgi:hypothetical protein